MWWIFGDMTGHILDVHLVYRSAKVLSLFWMFIFILLLYGSSKNSMSGHAHLHHYSINLITKAMFLDMFNMTIIILSLYCQLSCCMSKSSCLSQHDYVHGYVPYSRCSHFPSVTIHTMVHWVGSFHSIHSDLTQLCFIEFSHL